MKKIIALALCLIMVLGIASTAFAGKCDECSKNYVEKCNRKHHSFGSYIQCTRDNTNCDFRGDYFSNYYRCSNGHEKIANKHLHGIQHSFCGNSFVDCPLPGK